MGVKKEQRGEVSLPIKVPPLMIFFCKVSLHCLASSGVHSHQCVWVCGFVESDSVPNYYILSVPEIPPTQTYCFEINLFINASGTITSNAVVKMRWEQCTVGIRLLECQGLQEVGEGFCKFQDEDINDEIHLLHYFYLGWCLLSKPIKQTAPLPKLL